MTTITTSYKNADTHGRPAFEVMDDYAQTNLLAGSEPPLEGAHPFLLGDSLTLAQFSVVGLSSGKLVMATDSIKPIGVLAHAATSGASNTTKYGNVWLSGCFNLDGPLVWEATLNTEAERLAAFQDSPTPTRIIIRKRTAA